jgi:hypothetical protein
MIREFVNRLADRDTGRALSLLTITPYVTWTEAMVDECVWSYSPTYYEASDAERQHLQQRGQVPRVTHLDDMDIAGKRAYVYETRDPDLFQIEYTMPLDGTWSDLTAWFLFQKRDGELRMELRGIAVI